MISPAAHQLEQTPTAVVVHLVGLEVVGELGDAAGQERDLNLGGTGVAVVAPVVGDRALLLFSA